MTQERILQEFEELTPEDQLSVARAIFLHISSAAHPESPNQLSRRKTAIKRLDGAIKWPGNIPSDEELEELRDDYLARKYQ